MSDLPLNALRAFEVAARAGSFTAAGAELGVTAAAVSQQVKALEGLVGKRLFDRQGNRILLTDAGRAVYPRLEVAFSDLSAVVADLGAVQGARPFVLSALPSLADLWLMPQLAAMGFAAAVEVRVEGDPAVFGRGGADLRVTYGAQLYPDHRVIPLFRDHLVAVAAPGLCDGGDLGAVPDARLIHTDWGPDYLRQPSWRAWFAAKGSERRPDPAQGLHVGLTSLAVAAARAGAGVALVPARLAAADVAAGRLERAAPGEMALPWDYVMVFPHAFERRRALQRVVAWLGVVSRI